MLFRRVTSRCRPRPRPMRQIRTAPPLRLFCTSQNRQTAQPIPKKPNPRQNRPRSSANNLKKKRTSKPKNNSELTVQAKRKVLVDALQNLTLQVEEVKEVMASSDILAKEEEEDVPSGASELGVSAIDTMLHSTADVLVEDVVSHVAKGWAEAAIDEQESKEAREAIKQFFNTRVAEVIAKTPHENIAQEMSKLMGGSSLSAAEVAKLLEESKGSIEYTTATQLTLDFWRQSWGGIIDLFSKQFAAEAAERMREILQQKLEDSLRKQLHSEVAKRLIDLETND